MSIPHYLEAFAFSPEPIVSRSDTGLVMCYNNFSTLADQRVRPVTPEEYAAWILLRYPGGRGVVSICAYDFRTRCNSTLPASETLAALDIIVEADAYVTHAKMMKYGIEHEKWELWQRIAYGVQLHIAHLLARHHEYALAVKAGEAESLYNFYKRKADGHPLEPAHAIAYDFAIQHFSKSGNDLAQE